jgi:hypothetical protein
MIHRLKSIMILAKMNEPGEDIAFGPDRRKERLQVKHGGLRVLG